MIHGRSLRFRMMVLFCCVVGVFLAVTYLVIYAIFAQETASQLDRQLVEAAKPVVADLIADPSEQDVATLDLPNQYLEMLDTSGRVLQSSRNLEGHPLDLGDLSLRGTETVFRTVDGGAKGSLRMALVPFQQGKDSLVLAIAAPTRDADQALARFRRMLIVVLPMSLVVMAVISAWYVGRSLRPIAGLTWHAARMVERLGDPQLRDLQAPLPVVNPRDELGRLAQTFNQLFARINAVLHQLRQFVSDASHELRTPLSVLRGETELLLSHPRPPEEYQKTLRVIDGELKKLDRIVEGLFTLSMADAGQLRLVSDPIYLDEVLDEACELAVPLARPKGIAIEREIEREIAYRGDEAFLRQLFLIFLDNAIKYSPPNTHVHVHLTRSNGFARVSFRDQGIGISGEHLPHIFERFYRATLPENGEARSGGLGLAIAQAIAQAQGGSIQCETELGRGSTFIVDLPLQTQN